MCFSLYRCHLRLNHINESYDSIITQNEDRSLFNEIFVKFTYFVGMITDQNFYDIFFYIFFILRLWLQPTAKGRSLSEPNIRLRPKVKIAPMVQHWNAPSEIISTLCVIAGSQVFSSFLPSFQRQNYVASLCLVLKR